MSLVKRLTTLCRRTERRFAYFMYRITGGFPFGGEEPILNTMNMHVLDAIANVQEAEDVNLGESLLRMLPKQGLRDKQWFDDSTQAYETYEFHVNSSQVDRSCFEVDNDVAEVPYEIDPFVDTLAEDEEAISLVQCGINPELSKLPQIPTENDLIDTEVDEFLPLKQDFSKLKDTSKSVRVISKTATKKKRETLAAGRSLRQEQAEKAAKIKRIELEAAGREANLNWSLLAYLEMCVATGQLNKALHSLNYYRAKSLNKQSPLVSNVQIFNLLLHAFAAKGNYPKVRDIFKFILDDKLIPTPQSFGAVLECLGRMPPQGSTLHKIEQTIKDIKKTGYSLNDLFNRCTYQGNQCEIILETIRRVDPAFTPNIIYPAKGYVCPLLTHLNESSSKLKSPVSGLILPKSLRELGIQQLKIELQGTITVKSIQKVEQKENLIHFRNILGKREAEWEAAIGEAFNRNMNSLVRQSARLKNQKAISLYPFLKVVPTNDLVKILIQEIRRLAEGSETYSPTVSQLHRELGGRVLSRFEVLHKKHHGILDKIDKLYKEYLLWYLNPKKYSDPAITNSREKWQQLLHKSQGSGPNVDIGERLWPNSVLASIGRFLYSIIMRDIKINPHFMKTGANFKSDQEVPAFYSIFRLQGAHFKEEIKPHPVLVKLFLAASRDELTFESNLLPMISPPLPWASIRTGGYLLSPARIIRLPHQAHQQRQRLEQCLPETLYPSLDSLNQLGCVPWKINQSVLDVVIDVFNNKGNEALAIPPPPSECPSAPPIDPAMTKQEKFNIHKQRLALKRRKAEMYSLWCDALYKLSLANHFRNDVFWFPHNMDFRGRVYPCPPHLNHLGSDVARAILVFAKGQPLGENGLDWLKIHLVNLTGLKKRESVADRLKYANERMPDIWDSAKNPIDGKKWWAESDEPWQTLACCMEITKAIESGEPELFVSHFPVHQDGSCNGLQHYAALGRDQAGAESVNLSPSESPQDVYSAVAALVEIQRQRDAEAGVVIAQVLEGFVKRKVVKQTVMTTVYGVTRFGARLQIAKQLKDIQNFPKEHIWPASLYLVGRTFESLQEMFTSTKEIQDWFTECARLISNVCGQNVEWVTPLGLPIVQPYLRQSKKVIDVHDPLRLKDYSNHFDTFERPNVMKQKNAFPPNYIHSLDSTHMMLTSLHCERKKITFVSVHDCFWTHPSSVEVMNKICREQFVALHSEPILEDLSHFLVHKYSYGEGDITRDGSVIDFAKRELNKTLQTVPQKGSFDLKRVLESIYFFS